MPCFGSAKIIFSINLAYAFKGTSRRRTHTLQSKAIHTEPEASTADTRFETSSLPSLFLHVMCFLNLKSTAHKTIRCPDPLVVRIRMQSKSNQCGQRDARINSEHLPKGRRGKPGQVRNARNAQMPAQLSASECLYRWFCSTLDLNRKAARMSVQMVGHFLALDVGAH